MTAGAGQRLRLFVALDLPDHARDSLLEWCEVALRGVSELRPVAQEALHATLCFLGSRPATEVQAIAAACDDATRSAGAIAELSFAAARWLPPRRPRVLAVELDDPAGALGRVQSAVSAALAQHGWYTPEKRPFLAHVTVARVRGRARVSATAVPPVPPLAFSASAVTLYRSRLRPSGALYESLASVPLSYPGRAG